MSIFFANLKQSMSLLIFSPKCSHSTELVNYINSNAHFKQIVQFHNINTMGIPAQYRNKITRVPTMLTKNGKFLVGKEIQNWLESLLPSEQIETCGFGKCEMTTLNGEGGSSFFSLDEYGRSLQPPMTPELEEKINKDVTQAYGDIKK